jgi:phage/conjugal plasmid C-4 type zinc finger TraR family protein
MDDGDRGQAAADFMLANALANQRSRTPRGDSRMMCIDCDKVIPEERRKAVPGCQRCISCQQKAEQDGC